MPEPDAVELIVMAGHEPEIVILVPATRFGVAVPLPPLATGRIPLTPVVSGNAVALARFPDAGVPNAVPEARIFAVTEPPPVGARLAPVPTSIAAVVFVLEVSDENALEPPLPQAAPLSTTV